MNKGKLLRERASAMLFSLPGRCDRGMVKLCCVATRNRVRSNCMRLRCFADCLAQAWTLGKLLQWKWMRKPVQQCPHVLAAGTMTNSSYHCKK